MTIVYQQGQAAISARHQQEVDMTCVTLPNDLQLVSDEVLPMVHGAKVAVEQGAPLHGDHRKAEL